MWINEVMSNSIDETYGLNFEWISTETGIVEEIGGVDKDCIVVPSISHENFQDNNEYIEIQVTEEEVVSDDWQVAEEEVVSDDWQVNATGGAEDIGFVMEESTEGDVVGSIDGTEDYLRLQRSPCKMCNHRISKKSSLSSNILGDSSRCNMCGAHYKRKSDDEVISDNWQVAEEEVVSDEWQVNASVVTDDMGFVMEESTEGDAVGSLDEDYLKLRPYSCTLCSLKFSKKSSLTSHMMSHQLEDSLRCNLCGAQYKRKYDLIEHTKIHSYMPGVQISLDQALPNVHPFKSGKIKKKVSKKKIAKKKAKWQTHLVPLTDTSFDNKPILVINSLFDVNSGSSSSKLKFDDILIKAESTEDEDYNILDDGEEKYPIIDPSRPYVCQHCGIGFAREKALISHNMIHAGDSAFECPHCHEMFISEKLLDAHQANRHPRIKILAKKKKLKTNLKKSLENDKLKTFQCEHCDASFTRYNQLKRHQRTLHIKSDVGIKEEVFDCDPLDIKEEVLTHNDLPATTDDLHSCNTCGEKYADLSELHSHMKSKHKWGHFCHVCGTAYRDAKSLTKHLLTHADSTHFFPCSVCHRLFYNRGKLKKHMEVAHYGKDGYRCGECGEMFADGAALAAHKQSRHNVGRLFPCVQCGKTFTSRSSQQIHIRVHTGEKPYGCRFCWKAFADGGTLRKHERIHTGEKPYVCPVCTKAFNQRVVLREHVRAHHSEGRGRSFECTVCREILAQSRDLVAHLVMHSDENTAKHRLPNTSTRKYSRRKDTSSTPHTSRKSQHYILDTPLSPCK